MSRLLYFARMSLMSRRPLLVVTITTDSAISVKAANQKILLQVQFLQSLAHNRRMIADLKLQGFCLAIQNVVQGLHIASDGVLGCSHILQNVICRNILRINDASNI